MKIGRPHTQPSLKLNSLSANIYTSAPYLSAELIASKVIKISLGVRCKILIYLRTTTLSADSSFCLSPKVHCLLKVHNFCFDFSRPVSWGIALKPAWLSGCFSEKDDGFNMACPGELIYGDGSGHSVAIFLQYLKVSGKTCRLA